MAFGSQCCELVFDIFSENCGGVMDGLLLQSTGAAKIIHIALYIILFHSYE